MYDNPDLPDSISKLLQSGPPMTIGVYGYYAVCPMTKETPGKMQFVCLQQASHLSAHKLAPDP